MSAPPISTPERRALEELEELCDRITLAEQRATRAHNELPPAVLLPRRKCREVLEHLANARKAANAARAELEAREGIDR